MAKRSNGERGPRGSVRIIGGEWRTRRVVIAEGTAVRPTPDRVRETLFNWLREIIVGARCLDLFAGSGVLGFEALSRGAKEVWFVERDPKSIAALTAQAAAFRVSPRIIRQEAESFLHGGAVTQFDIVFVDPPYDAPVEPILRLLAPWLAPRGVVYVERPAKPGLPATDGGAWIKRSSAGAVEFGLVSFEAAAA